MTTRHEPEREREALQFVEQTLGQTLGSDFQDALKNGQALCNFLNKLSPGAISKVNTRSMPFMCMENINNYIEATQKIGIPSEYSFMTVDLWEAKNLAQVALNIIAVKRHFGFGFERRTGTQIAIDLAPDDTTHNEAQREPENEINFERRGDISRTGGAKRAGILQLTDPQTCPMCTVPITVSCFTALGQTWHKDCFYCRKCGQNLSRTVFYEFDAKAYCDRCILVVNPQTNVRAVTKESNLF